MKFTSQNKQLTFDLFRSSLAELDKTNRWVMLGDLLPWAEIEKRYNSKLNNQVKGAGNKPARLIIGAIIIENQGKILSTGICDNCDTTSDTAEVSAAFPGLLSSCVVSGNGGSAVPNRYCLPFTPVRR